jgi:vancomycin resistance protein VanJ
MGIKLSGSSQPTGNAPAPSGQPAPGPAHDPYASPHLTTGQKILKWSRWTLAFLTIVYAIAVAVLVWLIEYDAEDHHLTSVMMYLPQYLLLLPLFILVPLSLIWMRLIVIQAIVAIYVLFFFMDYITAGPKTAEGVTIKVLTSNTGQHHGETIQEFGERNDPDIIVLQDAGGRGRFYTNMFPTLHARGHDQFLVLSKYEIEDGGILHDLLDQEDRPVAAWFKLKIGEQGLYLFNVHMPTPRDQLQAVKGFGILGSVAHRLKKGGHADKVYLENKDFFKHQLELAKQIVATAAESDLPFIVAGDFNVPTHGRSYHTYKRAWREAFAEVGSGYGYTFPGDAKKGISIPPWLRLDNIYCSKELTPVSAVVDAGRGSQHLAMIAELQLPR